MQQVKVKKRRERAKFSGRTHSKNGIASFSIGIILAVSLVMLIDYTFAIAGTASLYIGSAGVLIALLSIVGFVFGIRGLKEEDVYKISSSLGTLSNALVFAALVAIFVSGILN